jgi:hypothetical protein
MSQPNDPRDLLALILRRAATQDIVGRTKAKAKRGVALRDWALGVPRNLMDAQSGLALDDRDFVPSTHPE